MIAARMGLKRKDDREAMGLLEKLEDGSAVLGVVGLGYVGLPLDHESGEGGVFGRRVRYHAGQGRLGERGEELYPRCSHVRARLVGKQGLLQATTDFSRIGEVDAVAICVPTPLDEMKEPDTSFMENAAAQWRRTCAQARS